MPAINVNMYVEIPQPLVPLWTDTGNDENAIPATQTVPSGYPANQATDAWYAVSSSTQLEGDGQLRIYIPNGQQVSQFYQSGIGRWDAFTPNESDYFDQSTVTINGNEYTRYMYYSYDYFGVPNIGRFAFSFTIN